MVTTKTGNTVIQDLGFTYYRDGDRLGQSDSVSGGRRGYSYDQEDRLASVLRGAAGTWHGTTKTGGTSALPVRAISS
jgi:hypothetical protein